MDKTLMPKTKHDHKWTDRLKVLIFSLIMLAPLFAILFKCVYALNPNAKDSYYGETINDEKQEFITSNNFEVGKTYSVMYDITPYTITTPTTYINVSNFESQGTAKPNITRLRFITYNNLYLVDTYEDETIINEYNITTSILNMSFTFESISNNYLGEPFDKFYTMVPIKYTYIDNAFYYALDQIKEENSFNWVNKTLIYNPINTMLTTLTLPNNHVLAYLLTYWSIITALYIVFDIVIVMFTKLTHLIQ